MLKIFSLKTFDKQAFGKQKSTISRNNTFKNTQVSEYIKPLRINNKPKISFGKRLARFVKMVELEVSTKCDLNCSYCPVSLEPKKIPQQIMPTKIFGKILGDLQSIEYTEAIAFHRYGEPLLIKVENFIRATKKALPDVTTELFTNGTLLTKGRLKALHSSGIDKIIVTQHTPTGFIDTLSGIPDVLLENVYVRYGDELILNNRAGALPNITRSADLSNEPCLRPTGAMTVDIGGNVIVCVDDYHKKLNMGNISRMSIEQIWQSEEYVKIRELLSMGKRDFVDPCKYCSRGPTTFMASIPNLKELTDARYRKKLLLTTGDAHVHLW